LTAVRSGCIIDTSIKTKAGAFTNLPGFPEKVVPRKWDAAARNAVNKKIAPALQPQEGDMTTELPIETLITNRLRELGLGRAEFARRTGFKNEAKALRRLVELLQGETRSTRGLIEVLPRALDIPLATVNQAIEDTRTFIAEEAEAAWRAAFVPHAVIETERRIPSPIFAAALIGVDTLLGIEFDLTRGEGSFVGQSLDGLKARRKKWGNHIPTFGAVRGFTVNYAPDRATRHGLDGTLLEELTAAKRLGYATYRLK
jgi:hypothetical protein